MVLMSAESRRHWVASIRGSSGTSWYAIPIRACQWLSWFSLAGGRTLDEELIALAGEELGALDLNGRNSRSNSAQARK
jgi:hypothetical protein